MSAEMRMNDRLTQYWERLRKEAPLPEFTQFNAASIDDLWHQCVLFTIQPGGGDKPPVVNFYAIGDRARSLYGHEMIGRSVSTAQRHFQGAAIVRRIAEVISNPKPLYDEGQFVNDRSKIVKYRSCLLPFGTAEGRITHVIAGLSWREF